MANLKFIGNYNLAAPTSTTEGAYFEQFAQLNVCEWSKIIS